MLETGRYGRANFARPSFDDGNERIIDGVASWCSALNGKLPLRTGLRALLELVSGEVIALTRFRPESKQTGQSIIYDPCDRTLGIAPMSASQSALLLGNYLFKCQSGTAWLSSMMDADLNPRLVEFQQRRGFGELVVIPTHVSENIADVIEIHFQHANDNQRMAILKQLIPTLVSTWKDRNIGLFESSASIRQIEGVPCIDSLAPIMSLENPFKLTRTEYRLCLLLSRGYSMRAIEDVVNISTSTGRTHLRHIYQKTGCVTLADLTYRLVDERNPQSTALSIAAMVS